MTLPKPHGDKLHALLENPKLPEEDRPRVQAALERYAQWAKDMADLGDSASALSQMVGALNKYKQNIELELIFDSNQNFLYRQKGQLKLDNTIIEEFLPVLVTSVLADQLQPYALDFGPTTCFSALRFESSITAPGIGGGMRLREKAHDFAIGRPLFIQTSYHQDFRDSVIAETHIAYIAAECKTNLDKTMFQEAAATASDVKTSVPGAKYYLLCEWLDMTPINTHTTAIDEILILRKAKRIAANIRGHFSTAAGRRRHRAQLQEHLEAHPLAEDTFRRFLQHIQRTIDASTEDTILTRGYF